MAELIITDENWSSVCRPAQYRLCGTLPRDYEQVPYGSLNFAPPASVELIPMEEWPDRIADLERRRATLKHIWESASIGVWMQGRLNYCHAYSAVMCLMIQRVVQGLPRVDLSPSSVAAPITNYTNSGAYIHDDLRQMVNVGTATTDFVPHATTQRSAFKSGWQDDAAKYRVLEFTDLRPRNFQQHGSMLLSQFPVTVGLNYWRHAVADLVLRDMNSRLPATNIERYGVEFLNSHGTGFGDNGWAVRVGTRKFADAIYGIRQGALG